MSDEQYTSEPEMPESGGTGMPSMGDFSTGEGLISLAGQEYVGGSVRHQSHRPTRKRAQAHGLAKPRLACPRGACPRGASGRGLGCVEPTMTLVFVASAQMNRERRPPPHGWEFGADGSVC